MNQSDLIKYPDLIENQWYIPAFLKLEPTEIWGNSLDRYNVSNPFYQYLGGGQFSDEYGEPVDFFWDPELQLNVSTNSPDGFIQ